MGKVYFQLITKDRTDFLKLPRLNITKRIKSGYMIWLEMYGNGWPIGIGPIVMQ